LLMAVGLHGEYMKIEVLAIIPARGGSKSIPRKNILPLAGFPLVAYSIAAGLQARSVTRVIVSTDDPEIASISREYGAETPFLRPAEFSQDQTLDLPVFQHALSWLAEHEGYHPEVAVHLRPTSPVRPPGLVDEAVELLLEDPTADSVRGVVASGQNPYKMWRFADDGQMLPVLSVEGIQEAYNAPRQALPDTYWQTGHIDAIRVRTILEKGSLSGNRILPLVLDGRYTVDIDSIYDWHKTEILVTQGDADGILEMVWPSGTHAPSGQSPQRRPLPNKVRLLIMDFDGVITDNRVWVDGHGNEMVAAYRSDSLAIQRIKRAGIEPFVISTEKNPVVAARCNKMGVPYLQAIDDKAPTLQKLLVERGIDPSEVVYIGNDVNDLPCFPIVACAVVPSDAQPQALDKADLVLKSRGGYGAVRELCDLLLERTLRTKIVR
jgi:YrbI family 3-deoxy-D-manno-octulosonate 8-phosphate phosphatase